ncbi:hypothetical protein [Chachezhania antarctica]|uniref:hypothetical protein n=1 Tax=Chachezhania antarctica TaxID=2340860 RepID=UPI000EADA03C|nr:hypothetical protein [Chachezhania antarctica]|tara:strand:- start:493 stop:849 length:357 start_codon:yes stop_codon:yes gene_type:complete
MDSPRANTLIAICAALLLTALGILSAHHMAPDRSDTDPSVAVLLAMGATVDDICGPDGAAHDHDCPFCHKLPRSPQVQAPDRGHPVVYTLATDMSRDLVAGPRHFSPSTPVRAPPRLV